MSRRTRWKHSGARNAPDRRPSPPAPATVAPPADHPGPLTDYEAEQARQVAAWKGESPGMRGRLFAKVGRSVARFAERVIPDRVAREAIDKVYDEAELAANRGDIARQAGVNDIAELRHRSLEECDRLAHGVGGAAQGLAVAGGAATGAGGFLTATLDVPLLLGLALRTILKVGHCYGEPLDRPGDRRLVLGILMVAATDDPARKRQLLARLREVEDWLLEEAEEQVVEDEAMDLLIQVEVFDDIPGLGAITAGLQNLALLHQVAVASRRVFQERRLRQDGKVSAIEPAAPEHPEALGAGRDGRLSRWIYDGSYYLGFAAMFPVWMMANALGPADNALLRGFREGAAAAVEGADRAAGRLHAPAGPAGQMPKGLPGLAGT